MATMISSLFLCFGFSGSPFAQDEIPKNPSINKVVSVPKPRVLEIVDRPFPRLKLGLGSVIIKTEVVALCMDDKMWADHGHEWFSHPNFGMGHEGVGTVVDAGGSTKLNAGDRILLLVNDQRKFSLAHVNVGLYRGCEGHRRGQLGFPRKQ